MVRIQAPQLKAHPKRVGFRLYGHKGINSRCNQFRSQIITQQTAPGFAADGTYDKRRVYDSLDAHSPEVNILIPPCKNARIWKHGNINLERLKRDENLRAIRKNGCKESKKNSGYHVRSLAETNMFHLKIIFGNELSARLLETQTTQALVHCAVLNKTTRLGMPQSYKRA